jgi:hypothetical protein
MYRVVCGPPATFSIHYVLALETGCLSDSRLLEPPTRWGVSRLLPPHRSIKPKSSSLVQHDGNP